MSIDEYIQLHPTERVWRAGKDCIVEGMLQFDETAAHFAGPFEGGFAYFRLTDHRNLPGWTLLPLAEHQQRHRFSQHNLPWRLRGQFGQPAQSEEHLKKRLALLTPKELKEWERRLAGFQLDLPLVENPFSLFLGGNDDASYTKFYPTQEAAQADLDLLLSDQPLNFDLHVAENGFVFTN